MKFTCQVEIDLPRKRVVELFDNVNNLKYWQEGFVSFEHLSGEEGQPGAKSKLIYKQGKRSIELIETITTRNLPDEFHGMYDHENMRNSMKNYFTELTPKKTGWDAELDYTIKKGLMLRVMAAVAPGMFRKQSQKWMDNFKKWAEEKG
jgi:hypothetical protein